MKSLYPFLFLKQEEVILSLKIKQAFPECTLDLREIVKAQQEHPKVR